MLDVGLDVGATGSFLKQVSNGRGVFRGNLQISSALLGQRCLDHLIWVHPSLGNVGSLLERELQQCRCDVSPLFGLQRYSGVGIVIIDLRGMATDGPVKLDPIGRERTICRTFFKTEFDRSPGLAEVRA